MSAESFETPNPLKSAPPSILFSRPQLLVFHVEDSFDDQALFQAACKKANVPFVWQVAGSVQQGISYLDELLARSRSQSVRWPDLVVLDTQMPDANGLKVLEFIRRTPELRRLPVVIFTGSQDPELRRRAYDLGANSFLEKPTMFDETVKLVAALYGAWSNARRPVL